MKSRDRFMLYILCWLMFGAWVFVIVYEIFPVAVQHLENLDPFVALLAGLGIGSITTFIMMLLKDAHQFFFRKKGTTDEPR